MVRLLSLVGLLGGLLCLSAQAANDPKPGDPPATKNSANKAAPKADAKGKKKKEEHLCKLRLMWWLAPKDNFELGIQEENDRGEKRVTPIGISQMQINGIIDYHGEAEVKLMRKVPSGELDKKGKPIIVWSSYATLPLKPDDTDICAILFDNSKGGANFRIFDFKPASFPYGSLEVVNLTSVMVACSLDGKTIQVGPGKANLSHNNFALRSAPQIAMAVQQADGEAHILFMSRMIMSDSVRSLFFVIERPSENIDERYEVTSIVDMNPKPAGVVQSSEPTAEETGASPKETKPTAQ